MDHQTLLTRRLIAAGGVIVVVILLVLLVKSCADSRRENALKDYNRNVRTLVEHSKNAVGTQLFDTLSGANGQQATQLQETINQLRGVTDEDLAQAERLDAPDAMSKAQQDLELVLSLRRDGVTAIADQIQKAVGQSAGASEAVNQIAAQMQIFNASDIVYSQRVAPLVLGALKDDGIAASYDGTAGQQVLPSADFLRSISWMSPTYVANQLGATSPASANGTPAPGLHGHQIDSVSVGDVTLTPGASNQIPASPPPTFSVAFTNGGENTETNVKVSVEISGSGAPLTASTIVPSSAAGAQTTANVELTKTPPTNGTVNIKVTVQKVLGEETVDNNTQTFTALFE